MTPNSKIILILTACCAAIIPSTAFLVGVPSSPALGTTTTTTTSRRTFPSTTTSHHTPSSRSSLLQSQNQPTSSSNDSSKEATTTTTTTKTKSKQLPELTITHNPTPTQIASLATTPSHTQIKSGTWSEYIPSSSTSTHYIIKGTGSITFTPLEGDDNNIDNYNNNIGVPIRRRIKPGSLIECRGESQLLWDVDDTAASTTASEDNNSNGGMEILYSGSLVSEETGGILKVVAGVLGLVGIMGLGWIS